MLQDLFFSFFFFFFSNKIVLLRCIPATRNLNFLILPQLSFQRLVRAFLQRRSHSSQDLGRLARDLVPREHYVLLASQTGANHEPHDQFLAIRRGDYVNLPPSCQTVDELLS